jgi:hypothetical protein
MESLFFQESPEVEIGTNKFINVPTIIQWEDVPLLQVGQFIEAGYTTKLRVFHNDGTHIADVNGSQVYSTSAGVKAAVSCRTEDGGLLTVCEVEGKPIFELRRRNPGQLKGWAEIHAPEGVLIKVTDAETAALLGDGTALQVGGLAIRDGRFDGHEIGIHVTKQGIAFGGKGGKGMKFNFGGFTASASGGGGVAFVRDSDSVSLRADAGGETSVAHTNPDGTQIVRGAIGAPKSHDAPPSDSESRE